MGVQYTMDRGFNIQWVGRSKYHGYGVIYTMDKGFGNTTYKEFDITWVGESKYRLVPNGLMVSEEIIKKTQTTPFLILLCLLCCV
jgi:hypothetical protein